ncbi:MAG: SDR family oxidoreductase [Promethearchaeota archaeon]
MDLQYTGKIVVVTGASKGLGYACAEEIAKEGGHVILVSRNEENLKQAAATIEKVTGNSVEWFKSDISNLEEIQSLNSFIKEKFHRIDGLVINAGGPPPGDSLSVSEEEWGCSLNTNLLSVVRLCKVFVPMMLEQKFGRISAITSISAKQPIENLVLSNTTRLGVIGYLKTLSNEVCKHNILINTVLPGPTRTERLIELNKSRAKRLGVTIDEVEEIWIEKIPLGRLGDPKELAALVTFLLSAKNSYITGQVIAVDGGYVKSVL